MRSEPGDLLKTKLISIGMILQKELGLPNLKYKNRHKSLVKELYISAINSLEGGMGSCGVITAYQQVWLFWKPLISDNCIKINSTLSILVDLDIIKEIILEKYSKHPLCVYMR